MILRVAGAQPQQLQVVRFGGFKITSDLQKDRQVVERLRILRSQTQRLLIRGLSIFKLSGIFQSQGKVVMGLGIIRLNP